TRFARARQNHICEHVEPGVDVISTIMDIVAREDPAIQCVLNSPRTPEPMQERKKSSDSYRHANREFACTDKLEEIDHKARQRPRSEAEQQESNQRKKEEDPVTIIGLEISKKCASCDQIGIRSRGFDNADQQRACKIAKHDVIPEQDLVHG